MNVAIPRKTDDHLHRGEVLEILSVANNLVTAKTNSEEMIEFSIYDEDFLVLFSATKNEVNWIAKNFF